jgi:hypothetical protein
MIAPAKMTAPASSTTNSVQRGRVCRGEQHSRSDRVHAAGNGEEPAIQFGTDLLIGRNSTQGADAISTTATTKKSPASVAATRKMITRTRCAVPRGFATGLSADPVLIEPLSSLKQPHPKRSVSARADSPPSRARRPDTRCRESRSAGRQS